SPLIAVLRSHALQILVRQFPAKASVFIQIAPLIFLRHGGLTLFGNNRHALHNPVAVRACFAAVVVKLRHDRAGVIRHRLQGWAAHAATSGSALRSLPISISTSAMSSLISIARRSSTSSF